MTSLLELLIIFAAFVGFLIAGFIRHKKKTSEHLVCHLGSDCNAVVHSDFSKFFGFPVELLGMWYYALTALGHAALLAFPQLFPTWLEVGLLGFAVVGFLFSCYLVFIQAFTLKQWCTWCLFSAGLCTTIFFSAIGNVAGSAMTLLADGKDFIVIVHAFAMAIGVGAATIADLFFFKFLKDFKISESEADVLRTLSQAIWAALGIIVISGIGLFLPQAVVLSASSKFLIKMVVVMVIIANGAVLNLYVSPRLIQISFGEAHHHQKGELHHIRKVAFALGAISISSWYSAFLLGSLRGIPLSFTQALTIYGWILFGAIVLSQIMERAFSRRAFEE